MNVVRNPAPYRAPRSSELTELIRMELACRARDYFPDLGPDVAVRPVRRRAIMERTHSTLLQFEVDDRARRHGVFVKIPRRGTAEQVERLYETLRTLHDFAARRDEGVRVVRPLGCLPEHRALLTERVDGPMLDAALRAALDGGDHASLLRRCGAYLRAYHDELGAATVTSRATDIFHRRCAANLARLAEHGVSQDLRDRIRAGFERATGRLGTHLAGCITVGEFSIDNLILSRPNLFLVEASAPRPKFVYDDVAAFVNALTTLFWGTPWFFLAREPDRSLTRQFLVGYFSWHVPDELIGPFCAKHLCYQWCRALDSLASARRVPTWTLRRVLRQRTDAIFARLVIRHLPMESGT